MSSRKHPLQFNINASDGTIDIYSGNNGWFGLQFYVDLDEKSINGQNAQILSNNDNKILWETDLAQSLKLQLELTRSPSGNAVQIMPSLKNDSSCDVAFSAYGFQTAPSEKGPSLSTKACSWQYAHSENLRHEKYPHFSATYPFVRPLPPQLRFFGDSPSNGIPALFLGCQRNNTWLMTGAVTQRRHRLAWTLGLPQDKNGPIVFRSSFTWNGIDREVIPANSTITLETTMFSLISAQADGLYDVYIEELSDKYCFQGANSRLNYEPVFCTWNYGVLTNITEDICLERMRNVAQLQGGGYFQIDHGYQPQLSGEAAPFPENKENPQTPSSPELDVYYPDCSKAWDLSRFPSGPKGFVESCRKLGLRPAIWWSPRIAKDGIIVKQHPEWILHDHENNPIDVGHLLPDTSVPEVQEFLELCVRTITKEWGFEGMKLDFFSWAFDHPDIQYQVGKYTGIELKRWFLKMIRSFLGPQGYFLHCISCPLGNPFLAVDGCDAYRAGIDIHIGNWDHHVRSVKWLLPAVIATGKKSWFPNIDSCMGAPDIPINERRSRLALAYVTAGMLEFSGRIELLPEDAREDYRTICERYDPDSDVRIPDQQAFYGLPQPKLIMRNNPVKGKTFQKWKIAHTIAFFNWTDAECANVFDFKSLNKTLSDGNYIVKDFWTDEKYLVRENLLSVRLPPRSSVLLDIKII